MAAEQDLSNKYCVHSLDPIKLRRVFMLACRELFSTPDNYHDYSQHLENFIYSEDDNKRTLQVELDFTFDPEETDKFPAVFIGVGPIKFSAEVINKKVGVSEDLSRTDYADSAAVPVVLKFVAANPEDALALAITASAYFMGMRPKFMEKLNLSSMGINELSAVSEVDKAPEEHYQVSLVLSIMFSYTVTTVQESHRIKRFVIDMNSK